MGEEGAAAVVPAIETESLRVVYKGGILVRPIVGLEGLALQIERGEVFGFLGPNGAGKTTTLKTLVGLIEPTSGSARIFGLRAGSVESRKLLGFLPEEAYFYEYLTGFETLDFYGTLSGLKRDERRKRAEELLDKVGIADASKIPTRSYSKGMRQRLGLAAALIASPQLLILDEPMTGLDPIGRKEMRELIVQLGRDGTTIFFSSHIIADVEAICTRVAVLTRGKLAAVGRLDDLVSTRVHSVEVAVEGLKHSDLSELDQHVRDVIEDGKMLVVTLDDEDAASRVVSLAVSRGAKVRWMKPYSESLEDVFVRKAAEG